MRILPGPQGGGQFQDRLLGHAVQHVIGLGVEQDRAAHRVGPEIVMGHAAQAGLDPAQDDGTGGPAWVESFGKAADQVGVDDGGPVGTAVVLAAGGVIVAAARFLQGGVVGDHRVHAAGGHAPEQARLAQAGDIRVGFRVRLGDHADPVAGLDQHLPDHRRADKGAVDVGIAGHQDDVQAIPAQAFYFFDGRGEKHGVIIACLNEYKIRFPVLA